MPHFAAQIFDADRFTNSIADCEDALRWIYQSASRAAFGDVRLSDTRDFLRRTLVGVEFFLEPPMDEAERNRRLIPVNAILGMDPK